jgi:nucleotide-binding universal stress UspA family protein
VGEVVVGIDGSPASLEALRFALVEARLRGARLVALHAWQLPLAEAPGPFTLGLPTLETPVEEAAEAYAAAARSLLDQVVDAIAASEPGVEVERRVVEGGAAAALVEASSRADLLVVGARGHGGVAGMLLGSVSDQCARHARCPVIVVPPRRADR